MNGRLSRRRLLELAGVGGVAAVAGGGAGAALILRDHATSGSGEVIPFHGEQQAGILTPQQTHLRFASFDLTAAGQNDLRRLLRAWSAAAARMTAGTGLGDGYAGEYAPPADTGEAEGLGPAHMTLTFGFGAGLFDGRYGLAHKRPPPWPSCRRSRATSSTPPARAVTSASRRARMTRRSRFTLFAI